MLRRLSLAIAPLTLLPDFAAAQSASRLQAAQNVVSYELSFFADAHPTDAYDMVRRLPGFVLEEGDEEVRGFAGAIGNVLIDGRAPAGKQDSLEEVLRRIPAANVARIELIRGGAPGIDMAGHDMVANVVRLRRSAGQASAEAGMVIASDHVLRPTLHLDASREWGENRAEGAFALVRELDDDSGRGRLIELTPAGARSSAERRREWETTNTASASGAYQTVVAGGELSVDGRLRRERTRDEVLSAPFPSGAPVIAIERQTLWSGEIGSRLRRTIAEGTRIEGLLLRRQSRLHGIATEEDERFEERTNSAESIGRVDLRRERTGFTMYGSVEGVLNGLTSRSSLEESGGVVALPGSQVRVSERRAEAAFGIVWAPAPAVVVEPLLRIEHSSIRSTGDAAQRDSFLFWKPRLATSFPLAGGIIRATVEREVGQLDFTDFVASASLDRDEVSAGAVELRPPRTWAIGASYELAFWDEGAITLSYRHEWIEDIVDRIPVVRNREIFDAVGNIGSGWRQVAHVELALPLSRLGLEGMLLRGSITWLWSRVTDPVTGERRIISEDRPVEGDIRFSHDLPGGRLSWGIDLSLAQRERRFRFDEVRTEREAPGIDVHVELRPAPNWRLRLEAANLTSRTVGDVRERYEGLRSAGALESIERREIGTTPIVLFSIRRAFGGARDSDRQAGSTP